KGLDVCARGNLILGGSTAAGAHDLIIGVKAASGASNATWSSTMWAAGLRVDSTSVSAFSGAVAARGGTNVTWTRRIRELAAGAGLAKEDFTGTNLYTVGSDGTGTIEATAIGLGTGGKMLVGAATGTDSEAYEVLFGVQMP